MTQPVDAGSPALPPSMHNQMTPPGPSLPGSASPPPEPPARQSIDHRVLMGPNGIRAGWRFLIFAVIVFVLLAIYGIIVRAAAHGQVPRQPNFSSRAIATGEGAIFLIFLVASWIMTLIEKRKIADYGLPARKAFGKEFWQGAAIGFIAMSALLAALRVLGVFHFGSVALPGGTIAKNGLLFGIAFLLVGFSEEYTLRGYPLFTLTTGMGFWPAAILTSLAFGSLHLANGGEDWIGALSAGSFGFLFCLILRRTGSLWMPIGFHAAWDWAETFFYGVPDSGQVVQGHMLNPSFHGSKLLTGGSVGPEGSVLCFVVLALLWILFHFWLPQAKYPNPAALGPASSSPASVY